MQTRILRLQQSAQKVCQQEPEQCATIRFICEPGYQAFFDDCGCGCELVRGKQKEGAPRK
ncbi:hypothetical protein [Archangium violaceum]|uniref:hypothetical protein n=1 Tax=Archangium violaceum TaxID=83451 RepID=UPI0037C0D165